MKPPTSRAPTAAMLLLSAAAFLTDSACGQGRSGDLPQPHPDLPAEFQQLLPRGRIASVDSPRFVSAAEAEIADDAWVLGVVVEGQARAYSLNLLNEHEVVNDQVGNTAFAAVW